MARQFTGSLVRACVRACVLHMCAYVSLWPPLVTAAKCKVLDKKVLLNIGNMTRKAI